QALSEPAATADSISNTASDSYAENSNDAPKQVRPISATPATQDGTETIKK
ncbi:hypothetical protein BGZ83_000394, partial [Gryganskiella cystojenkinii]